MVESKSVDEFMDNRVFKPASSTCNDDKDIKFEVCEYPSQKYPFLQILNQPIPKIGYRYYYTIILSIQSQ